MEDRESEVQHKSSAEILSELFSAFNAKPPDLNADGNISDKSHKKHKKSKKKHKHKDKKHKKKSKHKKSSPSSSSGDDTDSDASSSKRKKLKTKKKLKELGLDLDTIFKNTVLVKQEPDLGEIKVKQEKPNNGYEKFEIKIKPDPEESKSETDRTDSQTNAKTDGETTNSDTKSTKKITIPNLKNSVAYETALKEKENEQNQKSNSNLKYEDGEILEDDIDSLSDDIPNDHILDDDSFRNSKSESHRHARKRRHSDKDRHLEKEKKSRHDKKDERDVKHKRKVDDRHDDHKHRHKKHRSLSRDRDRDKIDKERDRHLKHRRSSRDDIRSHRSHERNFYDPYDRDHRWHRTRSRSRSRERSRDHRRRSRSPSTTKSGIDKKKLLEIARRNAINMLKSGTLPDALTLGPTAQEKVIAAIKAGGKTIEELTDFCKNLSQKEALGELSSVSSGEDEVDLDDPEKAAVEKAFHHPFQIKDKPASIVMNIKNATALPIKTSKEKSAELLQQFPVSSGQLHRKTESEWVPVEPPKPVSIPPSAATSSTSLVPLTGSFVPSTPSVPAPVPPVVVPKPAPVVPLTTPAPDIDISSIVSQRLSALRKLQENPNDVQALTQMHRANRDMESWAQSKQQPGQFTGSTGANILSAAELSSGYQAWARKDQLTTAAPVSGGMGMHLLQKMGWRPGEGLGKEKSGTLEPLLLEVKLDKRGIVASDEQKTKKAKNNNPVSVNNRSLSNKHPVSLLGEYASKRKLGVPQYECCFECGPDHKKNFLFKVVVNGVEYKPNVACSTKKQAKADAALVCLQHLGVLPS